MDPAVYTVAMRRKLIRKSSIEINAQSIGVAVSTFLTDPTLAMGSEGVKTQGRIFLAFPPPLDLQVDFR